MNDGGEERILSVAPSIVDPAPRTKPRPTRAGLGLEHVYAPSDDGVDENLLVVLHGLGAHTPRSVAFGLSNLRPFLGDTMAPFARMAKQFKLPQTATLVVQGPELCVFPSTRYSGFHAEQRTPQDPVPRRRGGNVPVVYVIHLAWRAHRASEPAPGCASRAPGA